MEDLFECSHQLMHVYAWNDILLRQSLELITSSSTPLSSNLGLDFVYTFLQEQVAVYKARGYSTPILKQLECLRILNKLYTSVIVIC